MRKVRIGLRFSCRNEVVINGSVTKLVFASHNRGFLRTCEDRHKKIGTPYAFESRD